MFLDVWLFITIHVKTTERRNLVFQKYTHYNLEMGEKKSMFDGMRFKGPKENKNTIAQSEVHLNFTEIKKE